MVDRYNIGKEYYKNKNYQKAYKVFFELANLGDVNAQVSLATMLYNGIGVNIDTERAYHWFKIAANENNPEALYYYGMYCLEDIDNINEGKEYLSRACEHKYPLAITAMAYYYEYGDHGYEKNTNISIQLYKQACLLKERSACLNLYKLCKKVKKLSEFKAFLSNEIGYIKYFKIIMRLGA